MRSILHKSFDYVPSYSTDIKKTFARVIEQNAVKRAELLAKSAVFLGGMKKPSVNVVPLKGGNNAGK